MDAGFYRRFLEIGRFQVLKAGSICLSTQHHNFLRSLPLSSTRMKHNPPGEKVALQAQGWLLCCPSMGCSLGPGHVALGALGRSFCNLDALSHCSASLRQVQAALLPSAGSSVDPGQAALSIQGRSLCRPSSLLWLGWLGYRSAGFRLI